MLQFFDENTVIFNDFEGDGFVSRLCDYKTGKILRTYDRPIYCLSNDRTYALSLDFARLDRERPGYGYNGVWHKNLTYAAPADDGHDHSAETEAEIEPAELINASLFPERILKKKPSL